MENSDTDRLIKKVESLIPQFPTSYIGHGVDRVTGQGDRPETISDEEGINFAVKIRGEVGDRVTTGENALKIYELLWHFLNENPGKSPGKR